MEENPLTDSHEEATGDSGEQRIRVAECAFQHFSRDGFQKVSMETVAKELHISKKTIYKLFQSKEEVLETGIDIQENHIAAMLSELPGAFKKPSDLDSFTPAYSFFLSAFSRVLLEDLRENLPAIRSRIEKMENDNFRNPFLGILSNFLETGETTHQSAPDSVFMAWSGILSAQNNRSGKELASAMLKGIGKRKEKDKKKKDKKGRKKKKK